MKKLLVLLDTDDYEKIKLIQDRFLKDAITFMPKVIEVWEVDEENHMEKKI